MMMNFLKTETFELGFVLAEQIDALTTQPPLVSRFIINSTKNIQRLGLIDQLTFTIVPTNPDQTVGPYNQKYNTGILYSTNILRATIIDKLLNKKFKFRSRNNDVSYKVLPSSIKEKRKKNITKIRINLYLFLVFT